MNRRSIAWGMMAAWLAACQPPAEGREPTGDDSESNDGPTAGTDGEDSGGPSATGDGSGGLDDTGTSPSGGPDPDPGDPFDPPPPVLPLPEPQRQELAAAIDAWLGEPSVSNAAHGLLIVDSNASQVLYERNPDVPRKPASNTKLFSTAVAMDMLGRDHRPRVEVWATAAIDGAGTVTGDLHLLGYHDFSWSTEFYASGRTPLDLLATELYDAGLRQVQGGVVSQGEFLYNGQSLGTYSASAYREEAADQFDDALRAAGVDVSAAPSTSTSFDAPPGGVMLDHWDGLPLSVTAVPINVLSHNEFADVLLRHVGWELGGTSDYATGASQLVTWYDGLGLDSKGMGFNDGSGLSHDNRVNPRQVIDLLEAMRGRPAGVAWRDTFSIAGVRGTLGGRMQGDDTRGRVHGKTGTLTGVITTSGIVYNRWDQREYQFAILTNETADAGSTRAIHDAILSEVAADIRGEAPPPEAPVLRAVRHDPGTSVARIEWDEVEGADGYLVWLSPDGLTWDRDDARYVTDTTHRAGDLPFGDPTVFVRVSAIGPTGEGARSDVYSTLIADRPARVLVVDGNDRWQNEPQPENPLGRGHDFAAVHARALPPEDVGWDSVANETVLDGEVDLGDYDVVLWALGEESTVDETFSPAEQGLVADYLEGGGGLFVSGAEVGWDLVERGEDGDAEFFRTVLHAEYLGDGANTYLARPSGPLDALARWSFYTPGHMVAAFPDRLGPRPESEAIATYERGQPGDAAILFEGTGAVMLLGFPFESLDNAPQRAAFMTRALELLR